MRKASSSSNQDAERTSAGSCKGGREFQRECAMSFAQSPAAGFDEIHLADLNPGAGQEEKKCMRFEFMAEAARVRS